MQQMLIGFKWTVARPKYTGQLNTQANKTSQHSFNNFMNNSEKYRIINKYTLYTHTHTHTLQRYDNFVKVHKNCDISQISKQKYAYLLPFK